MSFQELDATLEEILGNYGRSFAEKAFGEESLEEDDLMLVFGLTQVTKAQNKQYWGRELGMCWQRLVTELCRLTCADFGPALREAADEICDFRLGIDAIDTKYRIGSGVSGTLKKFRQSGLRLTELGYRPVLLVLRNDNLPAALAACVRGGYAVKVGHEAYEYLRDATGINFQEWLKKRRDRYAVP